MPGEFIVFDEVHDVIVISIGDAEEVTWEGICSRGKEKILIEYVVWCTGDGEKEKEEREERREEEEGVRKKKKEETNLGSIAFEE